MADPTEFDSPVLLYGEDGTYDSSPDDAKGGTALKVQPPLAVLRQGARPRNQQPAQYLNWIINALALVLRALITGLRTRGVRTSSVTFTGSGTFTLPSTALPFVDLVGMGAGGGGGSGSGAGGGAGTLKRSGSAGGSARIGRTRVQVTPTTAIAVGIGVGGAGGAAVPDASSAAVAGNDGQDGGDSTFGALQTFKGAQRGKGGPLPSGNVGALGGGPVKNGSAPIIVLTAAGYDPTFIPPGVGQGGPTAQQGADGIAGAGSVFASGGAGGAAGDINDGFDNGGGGGGGAASEWPGNVPGAGGAGATHVGTNSSGVAGGAGTLGAGGGGGGAGGTILGTSGGGAGGKGGDGAITVIYYMPIFDGS